MKHLIKIHRRFIVSIEQRFFDIFRHLIEICVASSLKNFVQTIVRLLNIKYLNFKIHKFIVSIEQQFFDILRHSIFFSRLFFFRHSTFLCILQIDAINTLVREFRTSSNILNYCTRSHLSLKKFVQKIVRVIKKHLIKIQRRFIDSIEQQFFDIL